MICPLVSTVDEVLQDPAALDLIAADARAGVAALARRLPEAMHGFGFELRLQPTAAAVDFYTSVAARGGGREIWGRAPLMVSDVSPADTLAWRRVGAFATRWADPASLLHTPIAMVFLEFDAPFTAARPPSIFARVDAAIGDGAQQWAQAAPMVDDLARTLLGQPVDAATRAQLDTVFRALPPGGRVIDVAVMLPREQVAVRLFISVPRARLSGYLDALGWADEAGQLPGVLHALFPASAHVSLQIDVSASVGRRIGIELSPALSRETGDEWVTIGDRLQRFGLCGGDQSEALARWPGTGAPVAVGGRWPSRAVRLISHVKIVLEPPRPIEAKVYLWATRRFAAMA
ncbi:MAG TPA: hypothetical protein VGL59_07940 [Polyangia bacterium]|jgi:hypothetical protein